MFSSDTNNPREDSVLLRVKGAVRKGRSRSRSREDDASGPTSVVSLLRELRELEEEQIARGEKGISHKLFIDLLHDHGARLSAEEESYLCSAFDDDGDGYITLNRFVRHFTGLNVRRHNAILRAWEVLPKNEHGNVPCEALHNRYSRSGTRDDIHLTFSANTRPWDCSSDATSSVSQEDFIAFYASVSLEIPIDEDFELYMLREWEADTPKRPKMNETQREWGPEGDPLAIPRPLYVREALNMALGTSSRSYNYSHMQRVHPYVEPLPPLQRDYMSTTKDTFRVPAEEERLTSNTLRHR